MTFEDSGMDISSGNGSFLGNFGDGICSLFHLCLTLNCRDPYEEKRSEIIGSTPLDELSLEQVNKLACLRNLHETGQI